MKKVQTTIISIMALIGVVALPLPVLAASPTDSIQKGVNDIGGDQNQPTFEDGVKNVVNVLLFVLGAIAVIMIILGGIRYTTSNGDSSATTGAKNTILYAVVGLVVAILAYAIVNFVIKSFTT